MGARRNVLGRSRRRRGESDAVPAGEQGGVTIGEPKVLGKGETTAPPSPPEQQQPQPEQ